MKHQTVRDIAEWLAQSPRDSDYSPPQPRESFADSVRRAVDERGVLLGVVTQAQHRANVARTHARYQNRKRKMRKPSVSR